MGSLRATLARELHSRRWVQKREGKIAIGQRDPGRVMRRFHLPLTLAILTVADRRIVPEILAVE
jgi:hypothetical protein